MPLYKRPGSPIWYATYTDASGQRQRVTTGTADKKQAQEWLDQRMAQRWNTRMGRKPDHTWEDAAARWLDERRSKASIADDVSMLKWWGEKLKGLPLRKINRDIVMLFLAEKKLASSSSRANRYLALIRAIFNAAHRDWGWIDAISVPHVRAYNEPKKRVRYLSKGQIATLLSNLSGHQRDMVQFALATGLRQGNIKTLMWQDIDMTRRILSLPASRMKNGQALGIPLNADAMAVLHRRRGIDPTNVFTYRGGPVRQVNTKAWRAALKAAGIENYRWHDNRHTWASTMIQSGVPLHIIKVLGGWQNSAMVDRYAHLAPDHLHDYAATINGLTTEEKA